MDNRLFTVNLNHDLMVGMNYKINLITYYYLSCAYPQHRGDEGRYLLGWGTARSSNQAPNNATHKTKGT